MITHCKRGHEFTEDNTYMHPTGRRQCKICRYESHKIWVSNNRERHNELHAVWVRNNPEKQKSYWKGRQRYTRNRDLQKRYGLTIEEYESMIALQNNKCAICKLELTQPCVDHCHISGNIRKLLCSTCNSGLGMFKDSIETLEAAIQYLREHATIERDFDECFACE